MSKKPLRSDSTCQNCGSNVAERFCSHCGQENVETRRSFGYLLRHFIEDLTHYDGSFWPTIRYLLFKPAYLTIEYLSGKRARFLPPVRLYIFISFITFLLPHMLPEVERDETIDSRGTAKPDPFAKPPKFATLYFNSEGELAIRLPHTYRDLAQLDSMQAAKPLDDFDYWLQKKNIVLRKYSEVECANKFVELFMNSFSKALFLYLPLFAFSLWLFHGKKRWLYFDHAIFTLHYFSFLLLLFNLMTISDHFGFLGDALGYVQMILLLFVIVAVFVYFFVAHRRMYGESRLTSFFKSILIYTLNLALFVVVLAVLFIVSFVGLH